MFRPTVITTNVALLIAIHNQDKEKDHKPLIIALVVNVIAAFAEVIVSGKRLHE